MKYRKWSKMKDYDVIEYSKASGLYGLIRGEVYKKDRGFYFIVYKRGLADKILKTF
jgi:hypothetical protein